MGLDMYLNRYKLHGYTVKNAYAVENYIEWKAFCEKKPEEACSFFEWCRLEESAVTPEMIEALKPEYIMRTPAFSYSGRQYASIHQNVGYWRKANHIHNWFVVNVQNNVDDCGEYIVSREHLEQLKSDCERVLRAFKENNQDVASDVLPTVEGFFFGSTDYDEYYLEDIENTIKTITDVLTSTDFTTETITYRASW